MAFMPAPVGPDPKDEWAMYLIALTLLACAGCVTEAGHIRPTTLPTGKPGYVITCNSNRYDRCLSRAARVCAGAYTIIPQARSSTHSGRQTQCLVSATASQSWCLVTKTQTL